MKKYFRANYLDASAVIKILIDEQGSPPVRQYFNGSNCFYMTSLCFAEALGVLKAKHLRKEITPKGYLNRSYLFTVWLRERRVILDEVSFNDPNIFEEAERIVKKYGLDLSDALQLVTLKKGRFSNLGGESRSLLITADNGLAGAARGEGLMVWDCLNEAVPQV